MSILRIRLILPLLFLVSTVSAQKLKKDDRLTLANLKKHISYLADDKLEGRRAGSAGEKLAMEYISGQFRTLGVLPKGTNGFYQAFEINEGKQIGEGTMFSINDVSLKPGTEFFPLIFSAQKKIEAAPAIALQEPDMPWFIDLKDILEENKSNPHFDLADYIRNNSKKAFDKGATAVILFNTGEQDDKLAFNPKDRAEALPMPVIYVTKDAAKKYLHDETATLNLKLNVEITDKKREGHNVIGYIDNNAATTVVLGAHFDHLGYGEDGNSMLRT
ncbi:MAG TPA: hypothetical protein PK951_02910, partial [Chitinophagaceae bacterium]|nr:hypothetical protein [Chitinophagaceae bacterium]